MGHVHEGSAILHHLVEHVVTEQFQHVPDIIIIIIYSVLPKVMIYSRNCILKHPVMFTCLLSPPRLCPCSALSCPPLCQVLLTV